MDDVHGFSFMGACTGDLDAYGTCSECGGTADVTDDDGHGTHGAMPGGSAATMRS